MENIKITENFIYKYTNFGALSRKQAEILGIGWPVKKGWKFRLVGKKISLSEAKRFAREKRVSKAKRALSYEPDKLDKIIQLLEKIHEELLQR